MAREADSAPLLRWFLSLLYAVHKEGDWRWGVGEQVARTYQPIFPAITEIKVGSAWERGKVTQSW